MDSIRSGLERRAPTSCDLPHDVKREVRSAFSEGTFSWGLGNQLSGELKDIVSNHKVLRHCEIRGA